MEWFLRTKLLLFLPFWLLSLYTETNVIKRYFKGSKLTFVLFLDADGFNDDFDSHFGTEFIARYLVQLLSIPFVNVCLFINARIWYRLWDFSVYVAIAELVLSEFLQRVFSFDTRFESGPHFSERLILAYYLILVRWLVAVADAELGLRTTEKPGRG